ncbi:MAG: transcription elongation factor GreA [Chitinophagia bacterium]|nr:transcription elongation factor GreA [Chitinophagia bacterium]
MSGINYVSKETLEQMKAELTHLKTVGRAEIARQIAEAREKGDLKENAEYDAAKEAQGHHEAKVAQLETAIASARILDTKDIDLSKVSVLSKVKVLNHNTKKSIEYFLVSEKEADLKLGKISVTSPIGKGLLGKKIGEVVEISVPSGTLKFTIFTKIINREIPSHIIAEDDEFIAILDAFPLVEGHVLVIPKKEINNAFDLDDDLLSKWMLFAKPIAKAIQKSLPCKRCGVAIIGLEVPHAHMHLVPLQTAQDINFTNKTIEVPDSRQEQIAQLLKTNLK